MTTLETELEIKNDEEMGVESDTFTPTGKRFGLGAWGVVDEYTDPAGQSWALKSFSPNETGRRQMEERGWTEEDVMRREAIPLSAAQHHVVPRVIERDKKGKLFVAMPVYSRTLDERLGWGVDNDSSIETMKDVADALFYLHSVDGRAHGDVKPSNILVDSRGRAYLGDLGGTTCISAGGRGRVRGKFGNPNDANYKAPECFDEKARPSTRADIWSFGALGYRLFTGRGIRDGVENLEQMTAKEANKIIKKKLKSVPRAFRGFLGKCLAFESYERYSDGKEMKEDLDRIVENLGAGKKFRHYLKRAVPLAAGLAVLGWMSYKAAMYEPQELTIPQNQIVWVGSPGEWKVPEDRIEFSAEDLGLPKLSPSLRGEDEHLVKFSTSNKNVASLAKAYFAAVRTLGMHDREYTEAQFNLWGLYKYRREGPNGFNSTYPPVEYQVVAANISEALGRSRNPVGSVDLEDTLAIARVGIDKVDEARRASGGWDYKVYSGARGRNGELIIPAKEKGFIDTWLSYSYGVFR